MYSLYVTKTWINEVIIFQNCKSSLFLLTTRALSLSSLSRSPLTRLINWYHGSKQNIETNIQNSVPIYSTVLHKSSILASIIVYPKNEESALCAFAASNSHFTQNIGSKRFSTKPQFFQQISLIFKQKIYLDTHSCN